MVFGHYSRYLSDELGRVNKTPDSAPTCAPQEVLKGCDSHDCVRV